MQTYQEFATKHKLELHFQERSSRPSDGTEWSKGSRHFLCEILHDGMMTGWEFWFSQGPGIKREPDIAHILHCLAMDAHSAGDSFEEWCANFGYDTDSRKAYRTYEACEDTRDNLNRIFGDSALEELFFETSEDGE